MISGLSDFAAGADLLIQDSSIGPVQDDPPMEDVIWERFAIPYSEERTEKLKQTHCTATEAGQIAADAGVDTLILTHLLPHRDTGAMKREAETVFDGDVIVGEDKLSITI